MHPPSSVLAERGSTGPHDLVLVQQALRGDVASADALLQRLSCIVRFVYRLNRVLGCGLPADALEDVVQQVYAAVWPRLPDFAGSAAIESWVFGFCRNCLRAEVRRRRHGGKPTDFAEVSPPDAVPPASEAIEQDEELDVLRAELARLSPDERAVVEMRFLDELSFEEIARSLGLPASTVKDRCYRAMERLQGRMRRRDA